MSDGHKPSFSELVLRPEGSVVRKKSKSQSGEATVALGMAAIAFAAASMRRIRLEKTLISEMWESKTTLQSLQRIIKDGKELPKCVLLRGKLNATGHPVHSLAAQVKELQPLMGQISQPDNLFLDLAGQVKRGNIKLPSDFKHDDVELVKDDFSDRHSPIQNNLLISELLVTRLGCEATKTETKDKEGNVTIDIERHERSARFNVLHHRSCATGLHITDMNNEKASLQLPEYGEKELRAGDSPSLFLTLPDALNEFKRTTAVGNADKSFTHLSKYVHFDQSSATDLGSFQPSSVNTAIINANTSSLASSFTALDALGKLVPNGWLWSGNGFYDNHTGYWSTHTEVQILNYNTFRQQMIKAADENARYQDATEMTYQEMLDSRDRENCFRVVEIGIPAGDDVVVVGKPNILEDGSIEIGPPSVSRGISNARFFFRILKGHTIDNLMLHREGSLNVYLGFAGMGAITVLFGMDMIRDSLEVVYV